MILRAAQACDAAGIAAIWNHVITATSATFTTQTKPLDEVTALIVDRAPGFVVAEQGGQLAGFATFGPFRSGPGYAHTAEHSILLAGHAQGQGMGRALMTELEQIARAQGMHSLIGAVSGENAAGIAFHKAMGFAEAGRLPQVGRKFDRWMDLVLMHKPL